MIDSAMSLSDRRSNFYNTHSSTRLLL